LPFVTVLASQQPRQALRARAAQVKRMLERPCGPLGKLKSN